MLITNASNSSRRACVYPSHVETWSAVIGWISRNIRRKSVIIKDTCCEIAFVKSHVFRTRTIIVHRDYRLRRIICSAIRKNSVFEDSAISHNSYDKKRNDKIEFKSTWYQHKQGKKRRFEDQTISAKSIVSAYGYFQCLKKLYRLVIRLFDFKRKENPFDQKDQSGKYNQWQTYLIIKSTKKYNYNRERNNSSNPSQNIETVTTFKNVHQFIKYFFHKYIFLHFKINYTSISDVYKRFSLLNEVKDD